MKIETKRFEYHDEWGHGEHGHISLNICDINQPYTSEDLEYVFSDREKEYYNRKKNEKRKKEMFWSRKMAKISIKELSNLGIDDNLNVIDISKGQFNNPLVKGEQGNYQVSITHCQDHAAAISFPEELIIGLDMERVDHKKQSGIEEILTDREKKLVPEFLDREMFALIIWTTKEALSKFLKLGLAMSLDVLQISNVKPVEDGYESEFRYFSGLGAYTCISENIVYTIVCSKNLNLKEVKIH